MIKGERNANRENSLAARYFFIGLLIIAVYFGGLALTIDIIPDYLLGKEVERVTHELEANGFKVVVCDPTLLPSRAGSILKRGDLAYLNSSRKTLDDFIRTAKKHNVTTIYLSTQSIPVQFWFETQPKEWIGEMRIVNIYVYKVHRPHFIDLAEAWMFFLFLAVGLAIMVDLCWLVLHHD